MDHTVTEISVISLVMPLLSVQGPQYSLKDFELGFETGKVLFSVLSADSRTL